MKEHGLTLQQGLKLCRSKRWFVNPNLGFMKQLQVYAAELKDKRAKEDSGSQIKGLPLIGISSQAEALENLASAAARSSSYSNATNNNTPGNRLAGSKLIMSDKQKMTQSTGFNSS